MEEFEAWMLDLYKTAQDLYLIMNMTARGLGVSINCY